MMVAALLVLLLADSQPRPSFNCDRAAIRVERIICDDAQLARMDRYVGDRFTQERAYFTVNDPNAWSITRSLQRTYIKQRNRCADPTCIRDAYRAMIHQWFGGPRDRFYKREDELGYLHVEELGDGWVVVDVLAFDRPRTEPGSIIDSATTLIPIRDGQAEELADGDCGFRIKRDGDGWQITRSPSDHSRGCGLFGSKATFAGHYRPRPYPRKDGGPDR